MYVPFLLFVIVIVLVLIFWELSKINSRLKKSLECVAYNGIGHAKIVMHPLVVELASPSPFLPAIPCAASDLDGKVFSFDKE